MNKQTFAKLVLFGLAGCFSTVQAANLSIQLPNNSNLYTTTVGSFFDAKIYVDTLPDFAGFDINLTYNNANLSAVSLTSASIFGAANTETFANEITPGNIHLAEAIAGTSALVSGLQITNPTLLGTVRFKALKTDLNNLINFSNPAPEMYTFDNTPFGFSMLGANVTINAAPVPLPASIFLFVPGLLAVFGKRRSKVTV
ncbi:MULTISPECIES: cohesin domain-containing protein [Methylomonas]|uniref:Cohesin domain-containing protein n=2 Tax=Methylomonas TaxID=416 RepID=A0A140E6K1_9GAMM|nr:MULTISPECIES: cohesin domain-containing protein [Methylomonas]AMK79025.1 hypothetical protein JT25_021495 [Methylomonas denitrificans]OAH96922.1 hypothetical protein A1342_06940 [Methylomonas methanica]TCV74247.1 cohesin domain-containing protein [Methylomonas methanica]